MPKYIINTPSFTPVSFAERIKPIDAYKQTYDKITEDEMKTTALLDLIPSMLDTSNPKDAALYNQYQSFRDSISSMADNIASGNLRTMAADARALKSAYTQHFAKIPLAYNAKVEAIKNFKGGADWLGDRPEYHPTSDFIGNTPVFNGMNGADVYKTSKEVMQGISKSLYNDLGWHLNEELLNGYFTHVVTKGSTEDAVARFAKAIQEDSAINATAPLSDDKAFAYANRITNAMNSGYKSIVDYYHPESLTNPVEQQRFKGIVLSGMQAGSEADITEKELQYRGADAVRSGNGSGGGGGSSYGGSSFDFNGDGFSTGSTDADSTSGLASKKIRRLEGRAGVNPNDKSDKVYYATAKNWDEYNKAIEDINSGYSKYIYDYWKERYREETPFGGESPLGEMYYIDRMRKKFAGTIKEQQIKKEAINKVVQKYLVEPVEKLAKEYNYLGMENPYDNANYGAAIKDRGSAITNKTFSITPDTAAEEVTTIRNILSQGHKSGDPKGTIKLIDGKGASHDLTEKEALKIVNEIQNNISDAKLVGSNVYGILVNYGGQDYYFGRVNELKRTKDTIDKLKVVHDFTKAGYGMNSIIKQNTNVVNSYISKGVVPTSDLTDIGGGYCVAVYNVGNDIIKVLTDSSGKVLKLNGAPLVQKLSSYAAGDTELSSLIGKYAISSVYHLGIKPKSKAK